MSRWLTPREAAALLAVDAATVRNWIKMKLDGRSSKLRYVRLAGGKMWASKREVKRLARIISEARKRGNLP